MIEKRPLKSTGRLPEWLKNPSKENERALQLKRTLRRLRLHTVCQSARCPNINECFQKPTATFMILGDVCTRHCTFCGIKKGNPLPVDAEEPGRIAEIVRMLKLKHVVITSVTRDDLPDGGAAHFAETVKAIRNRIPETTIETLIPDFMGNESGVQIVVESGVDVLNHNMETVPRFYPSVRPEANVGRSLQVLRAAKRKKTGVMTKSGLMVGLGETRNEVVAVFKELLSAQCDALTIGQYLQPSKSNPPVYEYIQPEMFEFYRKKALDVGFKWVQSGPRVRSSFYAEEMISKFKGVIL